MGAAGPDGEADGNCDNPPVSLQRCRRERAESGPNSGEDANQLLPVRRIHAQQLSCPESARQRMQCLSGNARRG